MDTQEKRNINIILFASWGLNWTSVNKMAYSNKNIAKKIIFIAFADNKITLKQFSWRISPFAISYALQ